MENTLARRLVFFTQILAVLWIVSIVGLLQRLDARGFQRDLGAIQTLERAYRASRQTGPDSPEVLEGVWAMLAQDKVDLDNTRRNVRDDLADWLDRQGVSLTTIASFTGKPRTVPPDRVIPFYVIEVEADPKNQLSPTAVGRETEKAIRLLRSQTKPRTISVSTSFDAEGVELIPSTEADYRVIGVRLRGDQIEVVQEEMLPAHVQRGAIIEVTNLTATVEHIVGPSLWELSSRSFDQIDEVVRLGRSPKTLNRLETHYGHLSLANAQSRASQGVSSSLEKINIFGFSFAPSWVPLAVLLGSLVVMVGIFSSTWRIRRQGFQVFGEDVDAGVLKLLIDPPVLRFAVWVVLPTLAIWLALPEAPVTNSQFTTLIVGSVLLFLLGLASFIMQSIPNLNWKMPYVSTLKTAPEDETEDVVHNESE